MLRDNNNNNNNNNNVIIGRASVPSGASTGLHEALELRDKDAKRYHGKGVLTAVNNINSIIAKKLLGKDIRQLQTIDKTMLQLDGTHGKTNLGANAILAVSMASAKACALLERKPLYSILGNGKTLPVPFFNVINGGEHADNKLDIQEFMIVPYSKNFRESLRIGSEVYHELQKMIKKKYHGNSTNVGDEGGFAPNIQKTTEALDLIMKAIENLGYSKEVTLALDCAASEFHHHDGRYHLEGKKVSTQTLGDFYEKLAEFYPIISIEDPFDQDDFNGWKEFTNRNLQRRLKLQIVGDDLLVTNTSRINMALERKLCNSLLLKVNQIGTVSEAITAAKLTQKNKWTVMVSHRSGETTDDFIADLAVGLDTGQIKTGAPCRGERLAKLNRLLRIEEELGKKARFKKPWQR